MSKQLLILLFLTVFFPCTMSCVETILEIEPMGPEVSELESRPIIDSEPSEESDQYLDSCAEERCDNLDNDCDGAVDEGVLNACGECGDVPEEVCDTLDNDCDGAVDERACVVSDIDIDDDCVNVSCPPDAPYPIACNIIFEGSDSRGCVAYNPGESTIYLQEGDRCGVGSVTGTLTCSTIPGGRLNAMTCPMNKVEASYPRREGGCVETN